MQRYLTILCIITAMLPIKALAIEWDLFTGEPIAQPDTNQAQFVGQIEPGEAIMEQLPEDADETFFLPRVRLLGLNKITASASPIYIEVGEQVVFGNLEIQVHRCWQAPPYQNPENKALVEIWEEPPGDARRRIFYGWLFSSSQSLTSLEHPVYDVTVVECLEPVSEAENAGQPN